MDIGILTEDAMEFKQDALLDALFHLIYTEKGKRRTSLSHISLNFSHGQNTQTRLCVMCFVYDLLPENK